MNKTLHTALRNALCVSILAALVGCAEQQTVAPPQPLAAANPVFQIGPEPTSDAKGILLRMANFLAKTPEFSVNLNDSYDAVQPSGEKIEFAASRKLIVRRPDGLMVERVDSDGKKNMLFYDGKDITVYSPTENVYAQTTKAGGIDTAVKYFLKDLNMRLPLAVLLVSQLPNELEQRTEALDYVEKTTIYGLPAHHLAARTKTVDYQVWIAEGSQPLPLRIVLTYKLEEGQPQFRAQFSDWNLRPEINNAQFAFTPPEGVKKIAFLAQLPGIVPGGSKNPGLKRERK